MTNYYTVRDVSEMLDIPEASVTRYIREGRIRAEKLVRDWMISKKEYRRLSGVTHLDRRRSGTKGGRWE